MGDLSKRKQEKNTDDCRDSIPIVRIGNAAGSSGPWIFLASGKRMAVKPLQNLEANFGSKVIMSPSAYMTDETWMTVVPFLSKGIRKMPIICEHPNWWVVLTLEGFGSHVNVTEAQKVFHEHKIFVVKEEGDTSAVNQPYDQSVAKADKANILDLLDQIRFKLGVIDQWDLIGICCNALKKVGKDAWISFFKRVNLLHPDYRVDFVEWLMGIDGSLQCGEGTFLMLCLYFGRISAVMIDISS